MRQIGLSVSVALFIVLGFSAFGWCGDNCYLFDRGSDSWQACKEQAAEDDKLYDALAAQRQEMVDQSRQAQDNLAADDLTARMLEQMRQRRELDNQDK